jgi:hypothetical protein
MKGASGRGMGRQGGAAAQGRSARGCIHMHVGRVGPAEVSWAGRAVARRPGHVVSRWTAGERLCEMRMVSSESRRILVALTLCGWLVPLGLAGYYFIRSYLYYLL